MTFVLGIFSLFTINNVFVSLGGGYKKFPPAATPPNSNVEKELENLLKD